MIFKITIHRKTPVKWRRRPAHLLERVHTCHSPCVLCGNWQFSLGFLWKWDEFKINRLWKAFKMNMLTCLHLRKLYSQWCSSQHWSVFFLLEKKNVTFFFLLVQKKSQTLILEHQRVKSFFKFSYLHSQLAGQSFWLRISISCVCVHQCRCVRRP